VRRRARSGRKRRKEGVIAGGWGRRQGDGEFLDHRKRIVVEMKEDPSFYFFRIVIVGGKRQAGWINFRQKRVDLFGVVLSVFVVVTEESMRSSCM
jgi:hypothetical protein